MLELPVQQEPLRVALVYNQKKEDSIQTMDDEAAEPPSTITAPASSPNAIGILPAPAVPDDRYAEWDTAQTINAVRSALSEIHTVELIEADQHAYEKLLTVKPEIVFNIAEGLHGISREAQIPAILDFLQIPYSGSDPLTLSICLDKARTKEILSYYRIPTSPFQVVSSVDEITRCSMKFPVIVKPLHEGSSKGIYNTSVARDEAALRQEAEQVLETYHEPALVEEFLPGREFTVAMLGNDKDLTVLPIVEIKFDSLPPGVNPIYSFEAKWIWDRSDNPLDIFECPANISETLHNAIERVCRDAFRVLRCRDWCRIDVRLDYSGTPHIIELNPLPGILPNPEDNSCFPKSARAAGLNYSQLIQSVLAIAAKRYGLDHRTPIRQSLKRFA